jgi:DNA-binding NtrC family response regulator
MKDDPVMLLVHDRPAPLETVRSQLGNQDGEIRRARSCAEAALLLWSDPPPHVLLTDISLPDGNWADVLKLAEGAAQPVNVIVVSPFWDVGFYIAVIERGAFDFLVPPLATADLLYTVQSAIANALFRRRQLARRSPPLSSGSEGGASAGRGDSLNLENSESVGEEYIV